MDYSYHKQHSYRIIELDKTIVADTQYYPVLEEIYMIVNNNNSMQTTISPKKMVSMEKRLKKLEKQGMIDNLVFKSPITITI